MAATMEVALSALRVFCAPAFEKRIGLTGAAPIPMRQKSSRHR